jgi:hypothetical protein
MDFSSSSVKPTIQLGEFFNSGELFSAGPGAAAADPPAGAAVAAPPLAGRSLQLRLRLLDQPPAQPERLGDWVVRRLKADAN